MPKQKAEEKTKAKSLSQDEFASLVLELAKKNSTSEKIGEALRKEGIHTKEHGKVSRILKAKNSYQSPEMKNIQEKLDRITAHMEKNIQDKRAMRERERILALLRKQKAYHQISQK